MFVYTVKSGDSLYSISQRFNINFDTLRAVNGLQQFLQVVPGQALLITTDQYVVQPGDSFFTIARSAYVTIEDMQRANPGVNSNQLRVGQILNLPTPPKTVISNLSYTQLRIPSIDTALVNNFAPYLTYIALFEIHFNWNGDLSTLDDTDAVTAAWQRRVRPVITVTNLTSSGFSPELATRALNGTTVRENLIRNIINYMTSHGYGGVNIDFEGVRGSDRVVYASFLQELKSRMPQGTSLTVAVPAKVDDTAPWTRGYDYGAIGAAVDGVFLMAYDWHYVGSEPGPTAPLPNVEQTVQYAISQMPREKIFLGVPYYGYNWVVPVTPQNPGAAISSLAATNLAMRYQVPIQYSTRDQTAFFNYTDEEGQNHTVWFDDTRSLFAKALLAKRYRIGGIGAWQLNLSFPQAPYVLTRVFRIRKV
ncbi:glycosyl hydrolase family 18 protein [Terrilactibacillus laevilacticus]|uniref:Glycosyl hydrolase family 18 protein n=1 Tax=Terrilactibacillus laevilacticus TaxID=1380157 RepID=A0ABW5PMX1_9BACI|nr:glycosyl hydrolase family 18 protein [Terrilactibacillus laevilacticus]